MGRVMGPSDLAVPVGAAGESLGFAAGSPNPSEAEERGQRLVERGDRDAAGVLPGR